MSMAYDKVDDPIIFVRVSSISKGMDYRYHMIQDELDLTLE